MGGAAETTGNGGAPGTPEARQDGSSDGSRYTAGTQV
jgi:hypothetical protein